jgi:hypothetical protein
MSGGAEKQSIEETVILASLKGLPEGVHQMFYALALSPEDATLPMVASAQTTESFSCIHRPLFVM